MKPPLVAFYGDDLTGSTDTLSVLAEGGLRVLLFLDLPTEAERQAAGELDALGIAGASRMMSPAQMDQHLPAVFQALKATGARLVHYKTCSTFDSAPHIGSIGHAIALGRPWFRRGFVPVVVGQPGIGRYCLFGTLFATASAGGPVHRLDRHPTMARHPVTPMDEADLRAVLVRQGLREVGLLDINRLRSDAAADCFADIGQQSPDAVLFDVLEDSDFCRIGKLIGSALRSGDPVLGVGSSGLQQALLAGWDAMGENSPPPLAGGGGGEGANREPVRAPPLPPPPSHKGRGGSFPVDSAGPVFVVSGSRSPVTAAQIGAAERAGFAALALDPGAMVDPDRSAGSIEAAVIQAARHLASGQSVIAHTSLGPDDPRGLRDNARETLERLAHASGQLARLVLARTTIRRIGLAGGDTSSLAARAMGVRALEFQYRIAPGVPVCCVRASGPAMDGLQIMLKGGQMGPPETFVRLAAGAV